MSAMPPAQVFATVLLDELVRLGVRHVVVCPGSRSAPLAYAALAHERAGLLRLHVRTDERSAAFLALGIGKATGVPAAVVTTSGTAVANLHPAVLEAHEGRVPLLLLTSDRPHELRWSRANQTTRQSGIFGDSVRLALDLAAPAEGSDRMRFWRTSADRAVAAATGAFGAVPGPVHLNLALREPLTPRWETAAYEITGDDLPEEFRGRPDGSPWTAFEGTFSVPSSVPTSGPTAVPTSVSTAGPTAGPTGGHTSVPTAGPIDDVPRTLVVIGDAPDHVRRAAMDFAVRRGHPVLAEPFGTVGTGGTVGAFASIGSAGSERSGPPLPHGLLLAETPFALDPANAPDRLLVVGRLTLSRAVGEVLRRSGASCELLTCDPTWPDPSHVMERVRHWSVLLADRPGLADPEPGVRDGALGEACGDDWPSSESRRFAATWERAAARLTSVVEAEVPDSWPSGPAAALVMLGALPEGSRLLLGSSSLVRDIAYVRGCDSGDLVANRGLAGIDGCVSTAAGMALAEPGRPMYALVGDLTFLHDSAALTVGPDEAVPDLTVVVVNDDGGAIFDTLEYGAQGTKGRDPEAFGRLFATPTGTSLAELAAAHGVDHVQVGDAAGLAEQVRRRPEGLRVVEVLVPDQRARENRSRLIAAASEALD